MRLGRVCVGGRGTLITAQMLLVASKWLRRVSIGAALGQAKIIGEDEDKRIYSPGIA
jgi:hypothetical protein